VRRSAGCFTEEDANIAECFQDLRAVLVIQDALGLALFDEFVEGGKDALAGGHGEGGVLQFAQHRAKFLQREPLVGDGVGQGVEQFDDFVGWEFHGTKNAVENPSEDFFSDSPDAIALKEFLVRDWVVFGESRRRRRKDGMDAVEHGPGCMPEDLEFVRVNYSDIVIDVYLQEFEEVFLMGFEQGL
jgi:hypothetical protein